ncbi:MAG: hypothetical protein O7E57_05155, partial [Gammaproteobacteria bacterium]|nr:hypothetical protein [Gammaproteobacteria bacterium]
MKTIKAILEFVLSLRGLMIVIALFTLSPWRSNFPSHLDGLSFDLASRLYLKQNRSSDIAVVELPSEQLDFLLDDADRAAGTLELLASLTSTDTTLALLLPRAPRMQPLSAELLLHNMVSEQSGKPSNHMVQAAAIVDRQRRLPSLINQGKLFVGLPQAAFSFTPDSANALANSPADSSYFDYLPALLLPAPLELAPNETRFQSWPYNIENKLEVP